MGSLYVLECWKVVHSMNNFALPRRQRGDTDGRDVGGEEGFDANKYDFSTGPV